MRLARDTPDAINDIVRRLIAAGHVDDANTVQRIHLRMREAEDVVAALRLLRVTVDLYPSRLSTRF